MAAIAKAGVVGAGLLRLNLAAAHDSAGAVDEHRLHEQLRLAASTLDQEQRERRRIVEHRGADPPAACRNARHRTDRRLGNRIERA